MSIKDAQEARTIFEEAQKKVAEEEARQVLEIELAEKKMGSLILERARKEIDYFLMTIEEVAKRGQSKKTFKLGPLDTEQFLLAKKISFLLKEKFFTTSVRLDYPPAAKNQNEQKKNYIYLNVSW